MGFDKVGQTWSNSFIYFSDIHRYFAKVSQTCLQPPLPLLPLSSILLINPYVWGSHTTYCIDNRVLLRLKLKNENGGYPLASFTRFFSFCSSWWWCFCNAFFKLLEILQSTVLCCLFPLFYFSLTDKVSLEDSKSMSQAGDLAGEMELLRIGVTFAFNVLIEHTYSDL